MDQSHLVLVETTIKFLQFMTSFFAILLTATGATFYYYWTSKMKELKLRNLGILAIPAAIILGSFIFIGILYSKAIAGLAEGVITEYITFWFSWAGLILWIALLCTIVSLFLAFIRIHRKVQQKQADSTL